MQRKTQVSRGQNLQTPAPRGKRSKILRILPRTQQDAAADDICVTPLKRRLRAQGFYISIGSVGHRGEKLGMSTLTRTTHVGRFVAFVPRFSERKPRSHIAHRTTHCRHQRWRLENCGSTQFYHQVPLRANGRTPSVARCERVIWLRGRPLTASVLAAARLLLLLRACCCCCCCCCCCACCSAAAALLLLLLCYCCSSAAAALLLLLCCCCCSSAAAAAAAALLLLLLLLCCESAAAAPAAAAAPVVASCPLVCRCWRIVSLH